MSYEVIAALGDSITSGYFDEEGLGWFGRLSQKIAKLKMHGYGFCNISQSGDRICDAYHRMISEGASRDIDTMIIAIGVNDIVRRGQPDAQEDLSVGIRRKYWNKLFDLAQKLRIKLLVLDILPVIEEEEDHGEEEDLYNFNKDVIEYNKLLKKLCKERDIQFFERFDKWADLDLKKYYVDTVHPNAKAHEKIADEVFVEMKRIGMI